MPNYWTCWIIEYCMYLKSFLQAVFWWAMIVYTQYKYGIIFVFSCILCYNLFSALPAILVPRHTLTSDDGNIFPHSLEDLSTSVPENTSFTNIK